MAVSYEGHTTDLLSTSGLNREPSRLYLLTAQLTCFLLMTFVEMIFRKLKFYVSEIHVQMSRCLRYELLLGDNIMTMKSETCSLIGL